MQSLMIIMNEIMSGWIPNTSKLCDLPNYTHETRKIVPLVNMLKNSSECKSCVILYDDVVQSPDIQIRKKHSRDSSKLPDSSKSLVHAAEEFR